MYGWIFELEVTEVGENYVYIEKFEQFKFSNGKVELIMHVLSGNCLRINVSKDVNISHCQKVNFNKDSNVMCHLIKLVINDVIVKL